MGLVFERGEMGKWYDIILAYVGRGRVGRVG